MGGGWWIPDPCLVLFVEFSGCFIVGPSGINGSRVPIPSEPLFSTEPTHSVPTFQTSTTRMYRLKLIKVRLNVLINPAQIEEMN